MSNDCVSCDHPGENHFMGIGRCSGESFDPDYGRYACVCPKYERDSDD